MANRLGGFGTAAALVLSVGLFVPRLLSSNPDDWHKKTEFDVDQTLTGGVYRILPEKAQRLMQFAAIAGQDSATTVLAGSIESGMVTFVSRSKVFGLPDYTTVWQDGADLKIHARLRFGYKDFGVNAARVDEWIAQLNAL